MRWILRMKKLERLDIEYEFQHHLTPSAIEILKKSKSCPKLCNMLINEARTGQLTEAQVERWNETDPRLKIVYKPPYHRQN